MSDFLTRSEATTAGCTDASLTEVRGRRARARMRFFAPGDMCRRYREFFERFVADPDAEVSGPAARLLASAGPRRVVRIPAPPASGAPAGDAATSCGWVVKHEDYPFPVWLYRMAIPATSELEYGNLVSLQQRGIPVVKPIGFGYVGFWRCIRRSCLIAEEFDESVTVKAWGQGERGDIRAEEIRDLLLGFAPELAALHASGVYIRTLYAKNILVRRGATGRLELALCDVPRLRRVRSGRFHFGWAARDLATLDKWAVTHAGKADRREFLRVYLEALDRPIPVERWTNRVARRVDRMEHRSPVGKAHMQFKFLLKRLGIKKYWPF